LTVATNFPSSADSFTNPTTSDTLASVPHASQHADVNDAVEAIETALLDGAPLHIDDANERVGIGTTTPNHSLSFGSPADGTRSLALWENGTAFYGLGNDTNRLAFYASNASGTAERMVIDSSGNVGINDTTPSYTLDVNGDINATGDIRVGGVAVNGNLITGSTYYFTDNSQYAPEYGSNYYRTSLYTISAPSGKSISSVQLTVRSSAPAWVTITAQSGSSYSYYVWSKGASTGYVNYFLDCR